MMAVLRAISNLHSKIHNFIKRNKSYPAPVFKNEPKDAEEMRSILAGKVFINKSGVQYTFFNKLTSFPPPPCCSTKAILGGQYRPITVEELTEYNDWLKVNGKNLYPMVVWATKNGTPRLVELVPGGRKPVNLIKTPSNDCLAYSICVAIPEETSSEDNRSCL